MPSRPPVKSPVFGSDLPRPNVRFLFGTLAAVTTLMIAISFGIQFFLAPQKNTPVMIAVAVFQLLWLIAVTFWPSDPPRWLIAGSLAAINAASTVNIYYGGGYESVFGPLLYTYWIALGGLLLGPRACFLTALWCSACYGLMVVLEGNGVIPHYPLDPRYPTFVRPLNVGMGLMGIALVTYYALHQMHVVYKRAEELRAEAVQALSHDLKNPLGAIIGYADLLEGTVEEDLPARIQRIAQRAADMVHNVLDSGRIDAESFEVARESVDLGDVVTAVVDQCAFAAQDKRIRLEATVEASLPPVLGDAELLTRAIANLASNAIKYNAPGGTVQISCENSGNRLLVRVADSGPGIAPEDQPKLFRKFGRISRVEMPAGAGLGLYITRSIAVAHGGDVHVDSVVGQGTTFTLSLPSGAVT